MMPTETSESQAEPARPVPTTAMSLRKVLCGESFIEKMILLLLTAIITGIAVPLVITWINANEIKRQQSINEAKAKNEALLTAQSKLLDEFSDTIFMIQTLALDVSWHGTPDVANKELQKRAYDRYSDQIIGYIARWRAHIAKARILASSEAAKKMYDHFAAMFNQDTDIVKLFNRNATAAEWNSRHTENEEMLVKGDALLGELARDMGLSRRAVREDRPEP